MLPVPLVASELGDLGVYLGQCSGGGGVVASIAGGVGRPDPLDLSEGPVEGVVGELLAPHRSICSAGIGGGGDTRPARERDSLGGGDLRDGGGTAAEFAGDLVTGLALGVAGALLLGRRP